MASTLDRSDSVKALTLWASGNWNSCLPFSRHDWPVGTCTTPHLWVSPVPCGLHWDALVPLAFPSQVCNILIPLSSSPGLCDCLPFSLGLSSDSFLSSSSHRDLARSPWSVSGRQVTLVTLSWPVSASEVGQVTHVRPSCTQWAFRGTPSSRIPLLGKDREERM